MVEAVPATTEQSREQIRDELIELAEKHVAARETYKSLKTDAKMDLAIW